MQRSQVLRRVGVGVAVLLVLLLGLVAVVGTALLRQSLPQTSGRIQLDGLGGDVTVYRDGRGVPQIYADSADDLFRAQGYVAAQDRFFEMDFRRHVTAGRLAELVGSAGVATDRVVRTLGWRRVAEQELPKLAPSTRAYLSAYADGVNDYLARSGGDNANVSLEYPVLAQRLPGYTIERWSALDSLTWLKAMAWDLRANYDDELARARLGTSYSQAQLKLIYPDYASTGHPSILSPQDWSPRTTSAGSALPSALLAAPAAVTTGDPAVAAGASDLYAGVQQALDALPTLVGHGEGIGSNSWVVGGAHTTTGKPLLANDPHLAVTMPGIWYQTGLHCRTVSATCPFDVSGFTFAGLPGVVIGHNQKISWGFTNLGADVSDFYLEKVTDGSYLRDGKQVPLTTRTETIKVAGGQDVPITVRSTVHGPVVSDVVDSAAAVGRKALVRLTPQQDTYAVSLAWTGLVPSTTADAIFALDRATDFPSFQAAAKLFAVPAQNLVYADTAGHIGYQTPGLIPVRATSVPNTVPGYWPAPGWDSAYDWKGYVAFDRLPYAYDPPAGYVVTANNQVTTARGGPFLTTDWDLGYRADRITTMVTARIAGGGKVSPDDMRSMQLDTTNEFAPVLVKALLSVDLSSTVEEDPTTDVALAQFTEQGRQLLADWDWTQPADKSKAGIRAAYFNAVWVRLLQYTFNDELPTDLQANGSSRWMAAVTALLQQPNNPWWDDKQTPGVVESRDEILKKALVGARLDLTRHLGKDPVTWSWGELHQVTFRSQVLGGDAVPWYVRAIFNRGPIGLPGGSSIVDANGYNAAGKSGTRAGAFDSSTFDVTSAPSMRMVVDLGDLDASTWVNQSGNSGHAGSPHYVDQADAWAEGRQYPWPSSEAAVKAAADQTLTLSSSRTP